MSKQNRTPDYLPPEGGEKSRKAGKQSKKQKKEKSGAVGRFIRRFLLMFFTILILLVAGLALVLNTVFNGPSTSARDTLTMSLTEASATKWVPGLFLPDDVVYQIRNVKGDAMTEQVTDTSQVSFNNDTLSVVTDEWKDYPDGIRIEDYSGDTYDAHIMIIRNPAQLYMATSTDGKFSRNVPGTRITNEIESEGAIAAINAGAFFDNGTASAEVGSTPEGLVIANGEIRWNSGKPPQEGFVGITNENILVVAKSMSSKEAMDLGVRDGCEFGPVLIINGEVNQEAYNANSGYNPRTCLGQRADGAIIFLCIDGRQAGSLGGTYRDCIDIMMEYGAVNACNMDGGSSSVMLYRDTYGRYGEKGEVQMINNYSLLQSEPRRMPNFWMIRPAEEG